MTNTSKSINGLADNLQPAEVLYFFDEPIIFRASGRVSPLLCNKVDEGAGFGRYLVVSSSEKLIESLKSGVKSVRAAFMQPWCWIVDADKDLNILNVRGIAIEDLPEDYLPDPGVGLYAYHGRIVDGLDSAQDPFLSIRFAGGVLAPEIINFSVFKSLVDEVYVSLRKVFFPAFDDFTKAGLSENVLGRILHIPMRQPQLASLKIEIEKPSLSLNMVRNPPQIDWEEAAKRLDAATEAFISGIIPWTQVGVLPHYS